jgi:hypothetical protein
MIPTMLFGELKMNHKKKPWLRIGFALMFLTLAGCNLQAGIPSPASTSNNPTTAARSIPTSTSVPTTRAPTSIPIRPSVMITGTEQLVYDWSTDRCDDNELPDLPVRAFRDAAGMVQINLSSTTNYRMIGPDLDTLRMDCTPTLVSNLDKDPSHFSYSEWMGSPYTLDGTTVYALIHNEFYGSDSSLWYAQQDFGTSQGGNNWSFQGWYGANYSDMRFDAGNNRWQGSLDLCQIGNNWAHPALSCEPARTWISPVNGTITISGSTALYNPSGSNGVIVRILKNEVELWSVTIDSGDEQEYFFNLEEPVQAGDVIRFRVNARGDTNNDATYLNPKINLGPDPCPSQKRGNCSQYAITFAVSTDGGASFHRPPSPNPLVATLPYRYAPDWGFLGMWQPSNIVHNPKDGFYYVLIEQDYGVPNVDDRIQGSCVLRTQDLADPTSWRAWDGTGFNMRMIDPYAEPDADPAAHTCQNISRANLGYSALNYNLTYNSFFERFLLVGQSSNAEIPGFYYSLSEDLVNWSPMKLLMAADLAQNVNWKTPFLAYPALIDPDDTSRNFEVTGQTPYLYFTRFNSMSPVRDFDVVRVRVQFGK